LIELISEEMKKKISTVELFKFHFNVKRNESIDINKMPDIKNELYNCKINISGSYSYISTKIAKFEINLKLIDKYFLIDKNKL
jgi:hypothetical protein